MTMDDKHDWSRESMMTLWWQWQCRMHAMNDSNTTDTVQCSRDVNPQTAVKRVTAELAAIGLIKIVT